MKVGKPIAALLVIAVWATGVLGCATSGSAAGLVDEYLVLAREAEAAKDWARANQYYQKALRFDSRSRAVRMGLAGVMVRQDDFAKAADLYRGLVAEDPNNLLVREALAYLDLRAGRWQAAWDAYAALKEETGFRISVLHDMTLAGIELGKWAETLSLVDGLVEAKPDEARYRELAAYVEIAAPADISTDGRRVQTYLADAAVSADKLLALCDWMRRRDQANKAVALLEERCALPDADWRLRQELAVFDYAVRPERARSGLAALLKDGKVSAETVKGRIAWYSESDATAIMALLEELAAEKKDGEAPK